MTRLGARVLALAAVLAVLIVPLPAAAASLIGGTVTFKFFFPDGDTGVATDTKVVDSSGIPEFILLDLVGFDVDASSITVIFGGANTFPPPFSGAAFFD